MIPMPTLSLKLIAQLLGGLAIMAFVFSWYDRGNKIERQADLIEQIVQAATIAAVEPDENGERESLEPEQVPAAILVLKSSYSSAMLALSRIATDTEAAKAISDRADHRLADQIEDMQNRDAAQDPASWNPWGE